MKLRRRGISAVTSPGRIRFAVLAAVALVVSVAGSAGAAALVTSRQIKDGTVTGRDIHAHTITRADIKDGSLQPQDFLGGSVTGPAGSRSEWLSVTTAMVSSAIGSQTMS